MMLRLAKNKNYVAVSPNIKQRAEMNAPQSMPLIMEPESKYSYFSHICIIIILPEYLYLCICLKILYRSGHSIRFSELISIHYYSI